MAKRKAKHHHYDAMLKKHGMTPEESHCRMMQIANLARKADLLGAKQRAAAWKPIGLRNTNSTGSFASPDDAPQTRRRRSAIVRSRVDYRVEIPTDEDPIQQLLDDAAGIDDGMDMARRAMDEEAESEMSEGTASIYNGDENTYEEPEDSDAVEMDDEGSGSDWTVKGVNDSSDDEVSDAAEAEWDPAELEELKSIGEEDGYKSGDMEITLEGHEEDDEEEVEDKLEETGDEDTGVNDDGN